MCIVCQYPQRNNYAGADPQTVSCLHPSEVKIQRQNYEAAKWRIENNYSNWLCSKHLDNYRQVIEALEVYAKRRWGL